MAVLKKVNGDAEGQLIELKGDLTLIGRLPECTIILDADGVSRRHAEIRRDGDAYLLVDLRSRNRTLLNDRPIAPEVPHPLGPNDRIGICNVEFVYNPAPGKETARRPGPGVEELRVEEGPDVGPLHTLDASRSSALAATVRPEVKLAAVLDITRDLSSELNLDAVAPKVLDSLMRLYPGAERAFLVLVEPVTGKLIRKAFKHRPSRRSGLSGGPTDETPMSISRTIVNHVVGQKRAVLLQDAGNDKEFPTTASIADLKIRSVMCVPLLTPDSQVLGIIQLDTSDRKQFMQEDLDVLAAVASQAAIAIQNASLHENMIARERLNRDLKIAEQVQKRFLPQSVPKIAGWEFFAYYHPTYEVGGDFYDFVPLPLGRLGVVLGDVSGKGVAAALMMAKFSGDARFCLMTQESPGAAAGVLNNTLCDAGIDEKFITLSLCLLDTGVSRLSFASAGHMPLMVRRADGSVEEIGDEISGYPLGVLPEVEYKQIEVDLHKGDVVVVYSDGVTDSRSPAEELYDTRDQRRLIRRVASAGGGAEAVGKAILQEIREFSKGHSQADDITLVCFGPLAR